MPVEPKRQAVGLSDWYPRWKRTSSARQCSTPCPHCGLLLAVSRTRTGVVFAFDVLQWERTCTHRRLQSPVLCLYAPAYGRTSCPN